MKNLSLDTWSDEDQRLKTKNRRKAVLIYVSMVLFSLIVWTFVLKGCAHADILQASYYSETSLKHDGQWDKSHGIMANGKLFDENALTCATRLYPLGSHLLITNIANNKSVLVVVTDRIGKRFAKSRIDLSKGAFLRLGRLSAGLIPIKVQLVNIKVKKG